MKLPRIFGALLPLALLLTAGCGGDPTGPPPSEEGEGTGEPPSERDALKPVVDSLVTFR